MACISWELFILSTRHLTRALLRDQGSAVLSLVWFGLMIRSIPINLTGVVDRGSSSFTTNTDFPVQGSVHRVELHWALNKQVSSSVQSQGSVDRVLQPQGSVDRVLQPQSLQVTFTVSEKKSCDRPHHKQTAHSTQARSQQALLSALLRTDVTFNTWYSRWCISLCCENLNMSPFCDWSRPRTS